MKILIVNAHWNNRGDEAAIRAMIDSLKSETTLNEIKIMILSSNIKYFPYKEIEILDSFPDFRITRIFDMFFSLISYGKFAFTKEGKKFINAVNNADIVIHAPGGPSIGDLYSKLGVLELFYLYRLLIPIIKNKKVFLYAPSVGPFSSRLRNFIRRFVLKRIKVIIVRDNISGKYLKKQLNLNSHITLDSAFQNSIPSTYLDRYVIPKLSKKIENEKIVGMTITDLKWHPIYKDNTKLIDNIIKSLVDSTKYILNKGYFIFLIPQLFGEEKKLELTLLKTIQKLNNERIIILPEFLDSYAQQLIISKLFCVIGMRYHSNVFSAKMGVPSIAIYYEHKTKGFMEELKRSDLIIDVENISKDNIIKKFKYLEENYDEIKEQIEKRKPELKKKSQKTTKIIMKN